MLSCQQVKWPKMLDYHNNPRKHRLMKSLFNPVINYFFSGLILLLITTVIMQTVFAEEALWQFNHTLQTNSQDYIGTANRKDAYNVGYLISASYLETGSLAFSYDHTLVDLGNNASITENLSFLSARFHRYPDILSGKLSIRLDTYFGKDTLKYNQNTPPSSTPGPGQGPGYGKNKTYRTTQDSIQETIDISTYFFQCAFINHKKTLYTDIGYAYSKYSGRFNTKVSQITPSIGFGWNNSYDWIQWRAYVIALEKYTFAFDDKKFESIETKYTHWFADDASSRLEFIRFTLLSGNRVLAVDPDTTTLYSITDLQKTSLSSSIQWQLSKNNKLLAALQYDKYQNQTLVDNYDSYLFYLNLQLLH